VNLSKFCGGVFGLIFRCWFGEKLRSEQGGLFHIAFDFHFSLNEGVLRVQSSQTDLFKVRIDHIEGRVGGLIISFKDLTKYFTFP